MSKHWSEFVKINGFKMLISEFNSREDVLSLALRELKEIGIKVRSEKHKRAEVNSKKSQISKRSGLNFIFLAE